MPKFDQLYLDHLRETVRQAAAIVDETLPLLDYDTHPQARDTHIDDRHALRKVALDNLLVDMLDQPRVATSSPYDMGMLDDEDPRGGHRVQGIEGEGSDPYVDAPRTGLPPDNTVPGR